ncbi:hypothetical protein ACHAXS_010319 [Conticribra weissflogii]
MEETVVREVPEEGGSYWWKWYHRRCRILDKDDRSYGINGPTKLTFSQTDKTNIILQHAIEPTSKPSSRLTRKPTNNPSNAPTNKPTARITLKPTVNPTEKTTVTPTVSVTERLSNPPTIITTEQPTEPPTISATEQPTEPQTVPVTAPPTEPPTEPPTDPPIEPPTDSPTEVTTAEPTSSPTPSPTITFATPNPTGNPTLSPSFPCNLSPEDRAQAFRDIALTVTDSVTLDDPSSAQAQALDWIINEDFADSPCPEVGPCATVQRYIMAAFYFAADGGNWDQCNAANDLSSPTSLALADSQCNRVVTPFPLYNIGTLQQLDLNDNFLTGTLSTAIGQLDSLTFLQIDHNEIEGTIPTEVGLLSLLRIGFFNDNDLTGTMPLEVCALRNNTNPPGFLGTLVVDCNPPENPEVECSCCSSCNVIEA